MTLRRYIGVNPHGEPGSWTHELSGRLDEENFISEIEKCGSKLFGYGPGAIIDPIGSTEPTTPREQLIDRMVRICEAPADGHFGVLRIEDYMLWRDGVIPNTPRHPVKKPRKIFESDFERLSEDGMLLTREPVSVEDAWNATLGAAKRLQIGPLFRRVCCCPGPGTAHEIGVLSQHQ